VKSIKEHWLAGNRVTKNEMRFLLHDKLQSDLKEWVLKEGLPLVDIIEVLDNDRHLLPSWVHLNAQANTMVADAFAEEILERKCERRGD